MELSPDFAAFERGWAEGRNQLVTVRLAADLDTPVSLMLKLAEAQPLSFVLESVTGGEVRGRYSIVGMKPDLVWDCRDGRARINRQARYSEVFEDDLRPALDSLRALIAESRIEGGEPSDKIGCVRDFRLRNGDRIREKLLGLSDYDMFCTYSILESPMGVENYVATLRLTPVTDGDQTFLEWTAEFDCAPEREAELVNNIGGGVFQGGFDALKRAFGG